MRIHALLAFAAAATQAITLQAQEETKPTTLAQIEHFECECTCPDVGACECPILQDCGIAVPTGDGAGFGMASFGGASSTVVGNASQVFVPDMLTNSATATNVCGLEVSANKLCGDVFKMKQFDICGCIKVCEHECASGCEGNRHCLDGRYTTTAQRYTALDDTDVAEPGDFGDLCSAAGSIGNGAAGN
jgi:hypothetical protein